MMFHDRSPYRRRTKRTLITDPIFMFQIFSVLSRQRGRGASHRGTQCRRARPTGWERYEALKSLKRPCPFFPFWELLLKLIRMCRRQRKSDHCANERERRRFILIQYSGCQYIMGSSINSKLTKLRLGIAPKLNDGRH